VSIQEWDNLPYSKAWLLGSPVDADSAVKFSMLPGISHASTEKRL
jgi:hypothetical protein